MLAAASGRALARRTPSNVVTASDIVLPAPTATLPGTPATPGVADGLAVDGISPFITPNADFYRIDTALTLPRPNLDGWRLRFSGDVDTPFAVSYDELLAMPQVEAPVTIACVSNKVGGDLVGNAVWQGVPLSHPSGTGRRAVRAVSRSWADRSTASPSGSRPQRRSTAARPWWRSG